ncbi:peptide chain release factor 2 [Patulibacter brassicae]|jgi:peptide chain release factor 2|uniref:Peptide chain release factor 2 n=1 Tax=Patulibacter brassicae TaxID=1705717 RepID=A0ABU4VI06_9ACTN|nr:peptide chain release factor 2 [Patulibacter brassicae]MDX8151450.1 peptide chain release factor 2 [Patulibacter brassicae]
MAVPESAPQRIADARDRFAALEPHLRPDELRARVAELDAAMGESGFWDDQDRAAKTTAERSRATRRLEIHDQLASDLEDLEGLLELADEDDDLAEELVEQLDSVEKRLADLEEERLFTGPYDAGDALVTINAGAGGTDAQDWAEMVLRMQMRWAERRGFKVDLLEASAGEQAGIKSATFRVEGDHAYGLYGAERGVHRLVRISPFDSQGRRQTAFAGLEVAPVVEEVGDIEIRDEDLRVDTYRASGAGGQHVNKTDSAVRLTHQPTGIVVACQQERSQTANKETAMKMLYAKLVERAERERQEEIAKEKGEAQDVGWGSQIRSYVLNPYTMVKDLRTNVETGNVQNVLDGDLDEFVRAWLLQQAGEAEAAPAE